MGVEVCSRAKVNQGYAISSFRAGSKFVCSRTVNHPPVIKHPRQQQFLDFAKRNCSKYGPHNRVRHRHNVHRRQDNLVRASSSPLSSPLGNEYSRGTVLNSRYEVVTTLGRGGNAVTYRCNDMCNKNNPVAVKVLSLRELRNWKQLDLFQREGKTLESLNHPGIPRYIDTFEIDTETDRSFFLVQQIAEGESVETMIQRGWRVDETELSRIAQELLSILQYLGSRRPPVIHRDIKPSNIVIEGGKTGGKVFLVDFGGVQAAAATGDGDVPGSTIIGTYGFMSPEQFRGAAQPASDLYGLGATLLYMISGRLPSAFPMDRMKIDVSSVPMGDTMRTLVEGLLEPVLEDRLTADEAMALLMGDRLLRNAPSTSYSASIMGGSAFRRSNNNSSNSKNNIQTTYNGRPPQDVSFMPPRPTSRPGTTPRKPPGSRIQIIKKGPKLEIDIPPARFDSSSAATGAFAVAWNAFVAFWTASALAGGGIFFALFSLPFWFAGVNLIKSAFGRQFIRERLEIGLNKWTFKQQLAGLRNVGDTNGQSTSAIDWNKGSRKEASGRTDDLVGAAMQITGYINGIPQGQLVLRQGIETYYLGEGLDPLEQEWLAQVINDHLKQVAETKRDIETFYDADGYGDDDAQSVDEEIKREEFARFDAKLGVVDVDRIKAEAEMQAEQARKQALKLADDAERRAKRAAARVASFDRTGSSAGLGNDSFMTIELNSGEFNVLDDEEEEDNKKV